MFLGDSTLLEYHGVKTERGRQTRCTGVTLAPRVKDFCWKSRQDFQLTETNLSGELAEEGLNTKNNFSGINSPQS